MQNKVKAGFRSACGFVNRHSRKLVTCAVATGTVVLGVAAQAQTDATVIATNAQTAFGVIAPITITIAGFYVILAIARKVAH